MSKEKLKKSMFSNFILKITGGTGFVLLFIGAIFK